MIDADSVGSGASRRSFVLCGLIAAALLAGCAQTATIGAFREANRLESELKRAASTKSDVRRLLGEPTGSGHAVLPIDPRPREVWLYDNVAWKGAAGGRVAMRQQIMLIFFERELFDGFMWYDQDVQGWVDVQ